MNHESKEVHSNTNDHPACEISLPQLAAIFDLSSRQRSPLAKADSTVFQYVPTDKLRRSDTWIQAVPYSKIVAFTLVSYTRLRKEIKRVHPARNLQMEQQIERGKRLFPTTTTYYRLFFAPRASLFVHDLMNAAIE